MKKNNNELQKVIHDIESAKLALMPVVTRLLIKAIKTQFPLDKVLKLHLTECKPGGDYTRLGVEFTDLQEQIIRFTIHLKYSFMEQKIYTFYETYAFSTPNSSEFLNILFNIVEKVIKVEPLVTLSPAWFERGHTIK